MSKSIVFMISVAIFHFFLRHVDKESSNLLIENITKQHALSSALIKLTALNGTADTAHKLLHVQRSRTRANAIINVNVGHTHIFTFHLYSVLYFNVAVIAELLQGMNSIFTRRD
jgi:hypothetical protein